PTLSRSLGPRGAEVDGRAGEEGEAGALGGEAAGQREAEPARAAGDQDVPAAEVDGAAGAGEAAERPEPGDPSQRGEGGGAVFHAVPGSRTTLMQSSSLSRNVRYISGASSSGARCVMTNAGSMSPAALRRRRRGR